MTMDPASTSTLHFLDPDEEEENNDEKNWVEEDIEVINLDDIDELNYEVFLYVSSI